MSKSKPSTTVQLELNSSKEFHLYAFPKAVNNLPPFGGIGREGVSRMTGIIGIDVDTAMLNLANDFNTNWLFWFMRKHRNYETNIVVIEPSSLTLAEVKRLKKGYAVLASLNWVKRFKNKHYLINPKVMIPVTDNLAKVCEHWFEVTGEYLGSYTLGGDTTKDSAKRLHVNGQEYAQFLKNGVE